MAIYEYVCPHCRKILSFFVRNPGSGKKPKCPHCGSSDLERKISRFSVGTGAKSPGGKEEGAENDAGGGPEGMSPAEERRLERLMAKMGKDIDKIDENDPRQMGRFLRKFSEESGEDLGPEFREAVSRLEAGEDPEKVEEELGEAFGEEGEEGYGGLGGGPYSRDDQLYDL